MLKLISIEVILLVFIILNFSHLIFGQQSERVKIQKIQKIELLFYQQKVRRPIANDYDIFWSNKADFDTIVIVDQKLINKVQSEFKKMKKDDIGGFSFQLAVIRYESNQVIDTIYSDRFMQYWMIDGMNYQNKRNFFTKRFSKFFK